MVRAHFCWTMRRDRDEIARARKEREEKEACRRSRTTQDSFWPGWSPVNLLLMPLSAQISSNDVLGPPFPLPFSSFLFLFRSFSYVFFSSFSFSLLSSAEHHARNGRSLFCSSLYTRDTNAYGEKKRRCAHRGEGEREERRTRSTRRFPILTRGPPRKLLPFFFDRNSCPFRFLFHAVPAVVSFSIATSYSFSVKLIFELILVVTGSKELLKKRPFDLTYFVHVYFVPSAIF